MVFSASTSLQTRLAYRHRRASVRANAPSYFLTIASRSPRRARVQSGPSRARDTGCCIFALKDMPFFTCVFSYSVTFLVNKNSVFSSAKRLKFISDSSEAGICNLANTTIELTIRNEQSFHSFVPDFFLLRKMGILIYSIKFPYVSFSLISFKTRNWIILRETLCIYNARRSVAT